VARYAENGEHPGVVLRAQHAQSARAARHRPDDEPEFVQRVRCHAQALARIGQVHRHVHLGWALVAQGGQPCRGAGAAPGGIEHQVRAQREVLACAAVDDSGAGDALAVRCCGQVHDVVLIEQRDVGDAAQSRADVLLEEGPGGEIRGERGGAAGAHHEVPAQLVVQPGKVPAIQVVRAVHDHLIEDAREQLLEYLSAAGQQAMEVATLWHAPPSGGGFGRDVGQRIALHHRDRVEELAERSRGHQTRHARSQYQRVLADLCHTPPPVLSAYLTKAMLMVRKRGRQRSRLRHCCGAATHEVPETVAKPRVRRSRAVIVAE
jgi:hypothetical protein